LTLVFGAFLSKFFSGWVAARLVKIPAKESILIGISSTTKLTIAISMAFAALQVRLIDNQLFTAIVIVSAISTIINPSLLAYLVKKWMPSA
jgi:Kef-type K+ transport system membrane component KefB